MTSRLDKFTGLSRVSRWRERILSLAAARFTKRRAAALAGVLLTAVLLTASFFGQQDRVARGVYVDDAALGGLRRDDARRVIDQLAERAERKQLELRVGTRSLMITARDVGARWDVDATLAAAWSEGRRPNPLINARDWIGRWFAASRISPVVSVDLKRLRQLTPEWEARMLPQRPFQGDVLVREGNVEAVPPRRGTLLELDGTARALAAAFGSAGAAPAELPVVEVAPRLTIEAVKAAAERARRVLEGPVELFDLETGARLRVEGHQLGSLLRAKERARHAGAPRLGLELDAPGLETLLVPLRRELERPPRDAQFDVDREGRVAVVPSEPGVRLDTVVVAEALLQAATSPARRGVLPLDRSQGPALATADAEALGIRGVVSEFTTRHPCCQARVQNIHRIADLLNGAIVRPGQVFSVNEHVGPRTAKNGFVPAPTIEEGEFVDTLGGGVSQFATTLFNAVFYGGYAIIERQPHSYYFSRYPAGHEATLSFPKPDLIFKNDTDHGLLIRCEYGDTFIRVKLYGDNGGRRVEAKVSPKFDLKQPKVELVPNPKLEPDDEDVKEGGSVGWSVIVSRVLTLPDGTKREERRKVTYNAKVRRVEVHPCRIPEGEPGYTGEKCPVPEDEGA
jgi:vancomycin resistance protein YoaR